MIPKYVLSRSLIEILSLKGVKNLFTHVPDLRYSSSVVFSLLEAQLMHLAK